MAFDGITVANLVWELKQKIEGGRIQKIAQPERDELLITIKNQREIYRLQISASASLPFLYLTEKNKQSPMTAPNFCMLLRKHIGSAKILSVSQPSLERIVEFEFEHLDEMGDYAKKRLIIEIMGKHSNIIFCKEDGTILDSIKHVSAQMSSFREVLPGRTYFIPNTTDKKDPFSIGENDFSDILKHAPMNLQKALFQNFTGISPIIAEEIIYLASLDSDRSATDLSSTESTHLYHTFSRMMDQVSSHEFNPHVIYDKQNTPYEFASLTVQHLIDEQVHTVAYDSISALLEDFYASRDAINRIRQKSVDLRKIVQTALERNYKKYDLQLKQMEDTTKKDKHKIYGELINTYGYELVGGEKKLTCINYYTDEEVTIPLDPQLSAKENAQKQFDKYNKLKRTFEALEILVLETKKEVDHLESINTALDIALKEDDLMQIKDELSEFGFIKKRHLGGKKQKNTSKPFHYLSSDGFHLYVGKNNYQNEELTFKIATGNDWWFHAKGIPGSHVIVKAEGKDLPDRVYEEAAALAAYYSKGRNSEKVEIDYIQKKHVKKATGGAPGFVIYHTNYSLMAKPEILLKEI